MNAYARLLEVTMIECMIILAAHFSTFYLPQLSSKECMEKPKSLWLFDEVGYNLRFSNISDISI